MEKVFVTSDVTVAMALVTAGFSLRNAENCEGVHGKAIVCELDPEHNGLHANSLVEILKQGWPACAQRCNEIISRRGITASEYSELAFIESSAALYSRKKLLGEMLKVKPLITRDLGNGRTLVFREGTPKENIRALLSEVDK